MADIQKIIELIMNDEKLSGKIYRDEPIIKTASQMANYLPPEYREMRKIARSINANKMSEAQIFFMQAKLMEDFEDNFVYHGEFNRYFPTYQSMNDLQLRGYFSWRTRVRRGDIRKTSLSFVFVYIYELLNLIGVKDAEEGFEALRSFWSEYRILDSYIDSYMKRWLGDFVVYYNLDKSIISSFDSFDFENHLLNLINCCSCETDILFNSINALSSYNFENSRFYKDYSDDVKQVVCAVFKAYSEYHNKNRKSSLTEKLFGRIYSGPYYIFGSAVFHDKEKRKDYEYKIHDNLIYTCRNGVWSCKKFFGSRNKSTELGAILKAVDRLMRRKYNYSSLLKPDKTTKILNSLISKEIDLFLENKRRNSLPKIEIDLSKLQGIRTASEETRDKLIVDEEIFDEIETEEPKIKNETPLNDIEYQFMKLILNGDSYNEFIKNKGLMLSVVIDSVNEKLFDIFCDTVILFDGVSLEIIEDYEEELRGLIK